MIAGSAPTLHGSKRMESHAILCVSSSNFLHHRFVILHSDRERNRDSILLYVLNQPK
jgi:hypothetical protein